MEQIENIAVGLRKTARLEDLRKWHRVEVICPKCRHRAVINPKDLWARLPGRMRIAELGYKLRCTACGNRHGIDIGIGRLKRD